MEPHIRDAAIVPRRIVEAVEVADGKMGERAGLGEAELNRHAPAAGVIEPETPSAKAHTAA